MQLSHRSVESGGRGTYAESEPSFINSGGQRPRRDPPKKGLARQASLASPVP